MVAAKPKKSAKTKSNSVKATTKSSSKVNVSVKKHIIINPLSFSFILVLALVIYGYVKSNWPLVYIGLCLMFCTLLLHAILKHKKKASVPKQVQAANQPRIDKLVEKEMLLESIKVKQKIALFLALFLFSCAPLYVGYADTQWITLSLGALLFLVSIIGLFGNLVRLKKASPKKEIMKPAAETVKVPFQKIIEPKKKSIGAKFLFIVVIILILINGAIFFLPKSMWLYFGIVMGIAIIIFMILMIKHRKQKAVIKKDEPKPEIVDDDIKKILKITDELLGNLPDSVINAFAKSKDFELYKRVLDKYRIK
jgi:hypothetical protein